MKEEVLELLGKMKEKNDGWPISIEEFTDHSGELKSYRGAEKLLFTFEGEADLIQKMQDFIAEREEKQ